MCRAIVLVAGPRESLRKCASTTALVQQAGAGVHTCPAIGSSVVCAPLEPVLVRVAAKASDAFLWVSAGEGEGEGEEWSRVELRRSADAPDLFEAVLLAGPAPGVTRFTACADGEWASQFGESASLVCEAAPFERLRPTPQLAAALRASTDDLPTFAATLLAAGVLGAPDHAARLAAAPWLAVERNARQLVRWLFAPCLATANRVLDALPSPSRPPPPPVEGPLPLDLVQKLFAVASSGAVVGLICSLLEAEAARGAELPGALLDEVMQRFCAAGEELRLLHSRTVLAVLSPALVARLTTRLLDALELGEAAEHPQLGAAVRLVRCVALGAGRLAGTDESREALLRPLARATARLLPLLPVVDATRVVRTFARGAGAGPMAALFARALLRQRRTDEPAVVTAQRVELLADIWGSCSSSPEMRPLARRIAACVREAAGSKHAGVAGIGSVALGLL